MAESRHSIEKMSSGAIESRLSARPHLSASRDLSPSIRRIEEVEPDGLEHGDGPATGVQFLHRVFYVKISCVLADAENHADVPRGLTFRRPSQAVRLARRELNC